MINPIRLITVCIYNLQDSPQECLCDNEALLSGNFFLMFLIISEAMRLPTENALLKLDRFFNRVPSV